MKLTSVGLTAVLMLAGCSRTKAPEPKAEQEKKESTVEMGAEAQKHVGLQTTAVSLGQLTEFLQVTGTVQPVESRVVHVRPLARGRILDVVVRPGDRVKAGQVIAHLDNIEASEILTQLASARAEQQRLRVQLATQTKQAERQRRLSEIGAAPAKDYELASAEQRAIQESINSQESTIRGLVAKLQRFGASDDTNNPSLVTTALQAPFAGVVTRMQAAPGAVVSTENELFTIADLSQVWVQAEVYEKDLGRVKVGQTAYIRVDTYPDVRFSGRVTYISDLLDPQTRTARVRCEVPNPSFQLKLDMFATVELPTNFSREGIAVPASAIQQVEGKSVVFVRKGPQTFEPRTVEPGKQIRDQVEITAGLKPQEVIVSQGAFHLKSIIAGKDLGEED